MTYAFLVMKELIRYHTQQYHLVIDGREYNENAFLVSFANSSQFGNNACISPGSDISDGLIEVCILKKFPLIYSPVLATRLFIKNINRSAYIKIIPAREVMISSSEQLNFHIDGDPFPTGNTARLTINPLSLKVIV